MNLPAIVLVAYGVLYTVATVISLASKEDRSSRSTGGIAANLMILFLYWWAVLSITRGFAS